MPAAKTKDELLEVADKEYSKLQKVIDSVPPDVAMRSIEGNWSVRDVLVHRAHWIDLFLGWYAEGQAGKTVAFPAPGYKWNQLKEYNADLLARHQDVDWETAKAGFEDAHKRWHGLVGGLDQDALYAKPMKGGNNNWTTGRWAEAAASSHYRSAAKFIRACLREAAT